MTRSLLLSTALVIALYGCSGEEASLDAMQKDDSVGIAVKARQSNTLVPDNREILDLRIPPNPERNAYFGDLHVHTAYSFDAYVFGTTNTPADALRRLEAMVLIDGSALPLRAVRELIAHAIDLVVQVRRTEGRRRVVHEIARVVGGTPRIETVTPASGSWTR